MEGAHRSWGPPAGNNPHTSPDNGQPQGGRQDPGFGPGGPQHHPQRSPPPGHSGLPAPAPFPPFHSSQHSLASLAGLSQSSPRQPPSASQRPDAPTGPQSFTLPGISQVADRERERAAREEQIHVKEEEDRRHREQERQRLDQAPHQNQTSGPVHLHQPVALGPRTAHGPNGLLSNPTMVGPQQPPMPMNPGPAANLFVGGPVQPAQAHGPQQMQSGILAPYGPNGPAHPPSQQPQQMGQTSGQQPILNDALSYLDQVKVQFADHPDVYNRFLDIMKDFKSGAIDTPGVIARVSTLFAGNPDLIQGFNTFLPPGYRIECGGGDNPHDIRVTTPMGTTVHSMPAPQPLSRQDSNDGLPPANGNYTSQPVTMGGQAPYSPGRLVGPPLPSAQQQQFAALEAMNRGAGPEAQAALGHQHPDQCAGVNSLQNAAAAVNLAPGLRAPAVGASPRVDPVSLPGHDMGQGAAADPNAQAVSGMEKRGPVEFNHAINYVNKIKNRFASHPDIYKQFLEILQTYQRESKPIQDVYSQVTHLFKTAPDLLEDFKQFLPESAAQAKAAERARQLAEENIMTSNVRSEGAGLYGSPVASREPHVGTPAHNRNGLPPVANFAPTPASKDNNKRKRGERQGTVGSMNDSVAGPSAVKAPYNGQSGKRPKASHPIAKGPGEQPPSSPTLIPQLPMPLEPTTTSAATSEEFGFFDKAKKVIGNKSVFSEFLRLCNLFSSDLIDRTTLVHRSKAFLGGSAELTRWFQDWIGYDERDIVIENKPRIPSGRIMLSNCRGYGPSYRLLPKRERQKPCSGRDELCNSVLNDEWASHPTWASEESGFIAHRKNAHEEALHRIEEERHDYDFNIETCARTIQLLDPIATTLRRMDDAAQRAYQLPPNLGGQSETIYKRVIMKLYGRAKGAEVVESLLQRPYQVIPVLLNRLKERLETWKMAQREWEKVWREQTQKMFWRSLDHQAVQMKNNDRRQFQTKTLQSEILVKHEEMKRASLVDPSLLRLPQMEFVIDDEDVIVDATYLILRHAKDSLETDHPTLAHFIKDFVVIFFGLDGELFRERIDERFNRSSENESVDDPPSGGDDAASIKGRKGNGRHGNLLRAALDRGRKYGRKDQEDAQLLSRGSTPDVSMNPDEDLTLDGPDDAENRQDVSSGRWLDHPLSGNKFGTKDINPLEPHKRDLYRLWANTTIYCFIRLYIMLYERLSKLKNAESTVREIVKHAKSAKPAIELGISDKLPQEFFSDTSEGANYYSQMLQKFDDVLAGNIEFAEVEATLRRFYLHSGYPLYAFEKIVGTLARNAIQVMNSDGKDKSADIYQLFRKDRLKDTATAQQQTDYRKSVDKMIKDAEIYRIDFDQSRSKASIYFARKDDPIGIDNLNELSLEARWRFYIASYTSVDNTDGVDLSRVSYPFLISNIRAYGADPHADTFPPSVDEAHQAAFAERSSRFLDVKNEEKLNVRIAVNNYRAFFQQETYESWHAQPRDRAGGKMGVEAAEEVRRERERIVRRRFLKERVEGEEDGEGAEEGDAVDEAGLKEREAAFRDVLENSFKEANGERMEVD